jgi:SAM-dependent methyltransferase
VKSFCRETKLKLELNVPVSKCRPFSLAVLKRQLARVAPRWARPAVRRIHGLISAPRARLQISLGVRPLSYLWGWDRGLPIHRYYLEQFLREFAKDIRGHCLEFEGDCYVTRFGGRAVKKVDVLHVDVSNPLATIVADLTRNNDIPNDHFDCIVCTHVLHVIFDLKRAVAELYRILRPGGVLLVAVPHVSMCGPEFHEIWRFTEEGLRLVLSKEFGEKNVNVRAYGNSLTAAGEIRGLVADEFARAELNYTDPRFAVEVCARAVKESLDAQV